MTISTQTSVQTFSGNGATTTFSFSFVGGSVSDLEVLYTDSTGAISVLNPSVYTLVLNAPAVGQLWGIGGTVTYPTVGSPIASGTLLTVQRIVPFEQTVTLSNQGPLYPQTMEQGLDLLELQIQQIETAQEYSIQAPTSDLLPPSVLPSASLRADKYLFFDNNGNPTVVSGTPPTGSFPIGVSSKLVFLSGQASLPVADALAASLQGTLIIDKNYTLTASYTLLAPFVVFWGGIITLGNFNLTGSSQSLYLPPNKQTLAVTGTGRLLGTFLGANWSPETFGGVGASTGAGSLPFATVTRQSLQYLEDFACQTGNLVSISFGQAVYAVDQAIQNTVAGLGAQWVGKGQAYTALECTGGRARVFVGNSAATLVYELITFMTLIGTGPTGTTALLEIQGACSVRGTNLDFQFNGIGVLFHNKTGGQFTENALIIDSTWSANIARPVVFKVTSGDSSFRRSGVKGDCIWSPTVSTYNVFIDIGDNTADSAFLYEGVCFIEVTVDGGGFPAYVFNNLNAPSCNIAEGAITAEVSGGGSAVYGAKGSSIFFAGSFSVNGDIVRLGSMIIANEIMSISPFSRRGHAYIEAQSTTNLFAKTGTTNMPGYNAAFQRWNIILDAGSTYKWVGVLEVLVDTIGTANHVTTVSSNLQYDTGSLGAPTIGITSGGVVTVTNASFPGTNTIQVLGDIELWGTPS